MRQLFLQLVGNDLNLISLRTFPPPRFILTAVIAVIQIKQKMAQTRITKTILK